MEGLLFQTTYTLCKESKNSPVHYVAFEGNLYQFSCNNQINVHALIGQSAVGYCAGKPTGKSRVF